MPAARFVRERVYFPEVTFFAEEEKEILKLWERRNVFHTIINGARDCGRSEYSIYDGPPFVNGLPHYGHLLIGTIKDILVRYTYQCGSAVNRQFGWDCHGLSVENWVNKNLGINGFEDVNNIATYNEACLSFLARYMLEWKNIIQRMGHWVDFHSEYKTMSLQYMDSVWWVFKQLYMKGLIYEDIKVMPYSTGCKSPLSDFEAEQNYKNVISLSIIVAFPLLDEPGVSLLVWTINSWMLPSNLALCVNPNFEYVEVKNNSDNIYIILEDQLHLLPNDSYTIVNRRKGADLTGKAYEPLFPYFLRYKERGAFRVLNNTRLTANFGTGIVSQTPYFGKEDLECCVEAGIISKEEAIECPIDSCGCFTHPVTDFLGKHVKNADNEILWYLQSTKKLVGIKVMEDYYPFCWVTDTPLIYKAVRSWFLNVETIKDRLLAANSEVTWLLDFMKEKYFDKRLRNACDWIIGRNNYWGNPIPLWVSEDGEEVMCVSSIDELQILTGVQLDGIHRKDVDHLTIPSVRPGQPPLRRVPEVFDCWFESGCMPCAHNQTCHENFPENGDDFCGHLPAHFIAESIDQTQGWFYTLLVISTALFDKAPSITVVTNGLILASDNCKLSKSENNYPDPTQIILKYGADALRLYLINSPAMRGEHFKFEEKGVEDICNNVFVPWHNLCHFLIRNIEKYEDMGPVFKFIENQEVYSDNIIDKWVVSITESLLVYMENEMIEHRLYNVVPYLIKFLENLMNWYIRVNMDHFEGAQGLEKWKNSLTALFLAVYMSVLTLAPFVPFLTEFMFQRLVNWIKPDTDSEDLENRDRSEDSVHYKLAPSAHSSLIDKNLEKAMLYMQSIICLGFNIRNRKGIPMTNIILQMVVILPDNETREYLFKLRYYITWALNVMSIFLTIDKKKYRVILKAEPNYERLYERLKDEFEQICQAIKKLSDEDLQKFVVTKEIVVQGHKLTDQDLYLMHGSTDPAVEQQYEIQGDEVVILLDLTCGEAYNNEIEETRRIAKRIQKLQEKAQLVPPDEIVACYEIKRMSSNLATKVAVEHGWAIEVMTKTPLRDVADLPSYGVHPVVIEEMQEIKDEAMKLMLVRIEAKRDKSATSSESQSPKSYINVKLMNMKPRYGRSSYSKILLRDSQLGLITYKRLKQEIDLVFGIYGCTYGVYLYNDKLTRTDDTPVEEDIFHEAILEVFRSEYFDT